MVTPGVRSCAPGDPSLPEVSVPEGLPAALTIRVPTDLGFVRPVRKMIEALLSAQGWGEEAVADAGLIATEVLQNAVEHGSKNDGSEVVELHVALQVDAATIDVQDPGTGKGTQSLLRQDVTKPPPPDSPRGRGLFLVNRMVQTLDRSTAAGGGSLVRVRVRIEASVP
jgi:serine/threonine-protein kinase RsbW